MFDENSIIWINGEFKAAKDINISIFTHGLHYGTGIFEGCRAYGGKVFKMQEHHERLIKSGELVDVPVKYSIKELNDATAEVLKRNNLTDAYVRPLAWRGSEMLGMQSNKTSVNVAIMAWYWGNYYGEEKINQGIKLGHAEFIRPDPKCLPVQSKTTGIYFIGSMLKNRADTQGYDDVLMLDYRGYIAECAACNIFFVKNNELHTPIPDCFLNGITRQTVVEIAKKLGYKVVERHILPEELGSFSEAFTTGTAVEVMPVGEIFGVHKYPEKKVSLEIRGEYLTLAVS